MSDRTVVGCAAVVLAALLVGSACGIAIERDAEPIPLSEQPGHSLPCPRPDGSCARFGDTLKLRDDCDMLFPKHVRRHDTKRWTKCEDIERYGVVVTKANPTGDDYLQALYEESTREK